MKKLRAVKLGRNLVRIYRSIFPRLRRPRRTAYLRVGDATSSPTHLPPKRTAAGRLLTWGRVLTKHLLSINRLPPIEPRQPSKLPKGHLVVYVGNWEDGCPQPRRYLLPVVYFNHPLFEELLRKVEEVYGFHHPGGITIPCAVSDFEEVRMRVAVANGEVEKKLLCF